MIWRMRIGHYTPDTEIRLIDGRIDPPTAQTEALREHYGHPGMTDEDLFCLAFFDFSRSIKVALLDEGSMTPQELHARGAKVWEEAREAQSQLRRRARKRMKASKVYQQVCEDIFHAWVHGKQELPEMKVFEEDADCVPEPYLLFRGASLESEEPNLVFLTTNPGGGMPGQRMRSSLGLESRSTYQEAQADLTEYYKREIKTPSRYDGGKRHFSFAAGSRIKEMGEISDCLSAQGHLKSVGFVQCEIVPFHSGTLKNKDELVGLLETEGTLINRYVEALRSYLQHSHVIALDASKKLSKPEMWHGWIGYKANLMGFEEDRRKCLWHKSSREKNRSIEFYGDISAGLIRGYSFMDAGNHFPKEVDKMCDVFPSPPR